MPFLRRVVLVLSIGLVASAGVAGAGVPHFDANSPIGQTLMVQVGQKLTFTVTAVGSSPSDVLSLSLSGQPWSSTTTPQTPIYGGGNPVSMTFDFTPAPVHLGATTMTFMAQDQYGLSKLGPVFIHVVNCSGVVSAYGTACAGGLPKAPSLSVDGCPAIGQNLTVRVADGPTNGTTFMLFSYAAGQYGFANGCPLLLSMPVVAVPVTLNGAGTFEHSCVVPQFQGTVRVQAVTQAPNGAYASSSACAITVN